MTTVSEYIVAMEQKLQQFMIEMDSATEKVDWAIRWLYAGIIFSLTGLAILLLSQNVTGFATCLLLSVASQQIAHRVHDKAVRQAETAMESIGKEEMWIKKKQ